MGEVSSAWVPGEAEREPDDAPGLTATALRMMDESVMVWHRDPAYGAKLAADASAIFGGGVLLALQDMQIAGTLPPPGTPAWDEFVDQAETGDAVLVVSVVVRDREVATARPAPRVETNEEFHARLDRMVAEAEARKAPGGLRASRPEPAMPPSPPPKQAGELDEPGALSESLRKMGLL
jgi:hypothetical protein